MARREHLVRQPLCAEADEPVGLPLPQSVCKASWHRTSSDATVRLPLGEHGQVGGFCKRGELLVPIESLSGAE